MDIIYNETKVHEGNECLIYKTAIVGREQNSGEWVLVKLKSYRGSWTPSGTTSDCENYHSRGEALKAAEDWLC